MRQELPERSLWLAGVSGQRVSERPISLHSNESRAADLMPDFSLSPCVHSFKSKTQVVCLASAEASRHGGVGRGEAVLEHL